ncbi:hypothetical protein BJ912DRAFT_1022739 [Pholiota molesta]|nr:hypothetical protein BJ912DRAFT_1022739 [Pholiota molesta]
MDSTEYAQQQEMTALQSIYGDDFIEVPPPKAWKGAARLHEFIVRVSHPEPEHAARVSFDLHVKFPKTYPTLACPTFSIDKPLTGLTDAQASTLLRAINVEAQRFKGGEMVFEIVSFAQDWLRTHVIPPAEVVGSLALQMTQRAVEEARERERIEHEEAQKQREIAMMEAAALEYEISAAREQAQRSRRRANSEATEVPDVTIFDEDEDSMIETFSEMKLDSGIRFTSVRIYQPRAAYLGTIYTAMPILDPTIPVPPMELYSISFASHYYTTTQGRKKLTQVEHEIKSLINIRHTKLQTVFGVKLILPRGSDPPKLMVLNEQAPTLTLHDVLEECECFREDRASDYCTQILTALSALHQRDLVHKAITTRCIGLSVKLCRATYHTRLLDLHRTSSGGSSTGDREETLLPEGWVSRDVQHESTLLYTRMRDIHDVGVVLMQMLLGLSVVERFPDPASAIRSADITTLANQALVMLEPPKKHALTCDTLLAEFTAQSLTLRSPSASPAPDYFRLGAGMSQQRRQTSRWKEDWEELELLVRQRRVWVVVKAKNKIDSRIYAVKKIRLKTMQSDTKIFREVNALSRLSHRNIVRYYTTWVETYEPSASAAPSVSGESDSGDASSVEAMTSEQARPGSARLASDSTDDEDGTDGDFDEDSDASNSNERHLPVNGTFRLNLGDFDDVSVSRSSFPSIHFASRTPSPGGADDDDDDDGDGSTGSSSGEGDFAGLFNRSRERVDEGISEDEAWRLFQQIVDALAHMSTLNILHRDIKLTNIFIDAKGDCKVGDFGLATSSLAAVDPSDVASPAVIMEADMTLEVGTRLYIAPEVQSRRRGRGPRDHSKADMYSLGYIVFFEMNFKFNTGAERIAVLEDLRKPSVTFPSGWDTHRIRQKEIITWLLQHQPERRPSAIELSQSPLLPTRLEDDYYKNALRLIAKPDSPYHQTVLSTLFKQPPRPTRTYLYDSLLESPEYASLNNIVEDRLAAIFHLHGAVDMEPPLLMPITDIEEEKTHATFIDQYGDIVALPNNILIPFARLAARESIKRIKRYHIANVFRPNTVSGHPQYTKAALFDIISPDLVTGPIAAGAELIAVVNDCLDNFPNLSQNYDIHISHSKIIETVMNRVPVDIRQAVHDFVHPKSSAAQRRAILLKKGLLRSTVDELEILSDTKEDVDLIIAQLEKTAPTLVAAMQSAIQEVKDTISFAHSAGVSRQIFFRPLMLGSHNTHLKDGVIIEVVKRNKHTDVLAAGGRYDNLISRFLPTKQKAEPICALGIQIAVEKITAALASYQSASIKTLVKEDRSFGFWSPRRCDVYVVSYHPGYLQERLEVVSYLWQNGISADLMYESGLPDTEHENHLDICAREGILYVLLFKPSSSLRCTRAPHGATFAGIQVKSILKGTEVDRNVEQELVSWLQHQIAEQKRIDATTSGAPALNEPSLHVPVIKDTATNPSSNNTKSLFENKAFEKVTSLQGAFQAGMPVLGVDDAWKPIAAMFPAQHAAYAQQVREAALKRKAEGGAAGYLLLYAVREDRAALLALNP